MSCYGDCFAMPARGGRKLHTCVWIKIRRSTHANERCSCIEIAHHVDCHRRAETVKRDRHSQRKGPRLFPLTGALFSLAVWGRQMEHTAPAVRTSRFYMIETIGCCVTTVEQEALAKSKGERPDGPLLNPSPAARGRTGTPRGRTSAGKP